MMFVFIAKPNGFCLNSAFKDISMTMVDLKNQHTALGSCAEWLNLRCIFFCAGVTVMLEEVITLISSRRVTYCLSAEDMGCATRMGISSTC